MDRIAIIDGNSLLNRAYYAMRNPMITKDGIFTQGIFGFLNMMEKIKKDYEPAYMAIAFDLKAPTFRHKAYDAYKAGRKKMPPELAMQIPILKDVLRAMNIKQVEMEGFEADDLIGTIATEAEEDGLEPFIITGDKDELQLATDVTKIILTRKGVTEFEIYDKQAMIDKYGFTPTQFIDFKGLMGDQSDNIPGIPGVGEKTATKLILEYGSVENLIANVDDVKPKGVRAKVEEHAQLAMMSKRLATINTQVPIDIDFAEYKVTEPDYDALIELYSQLEFNRFLKKLNVQRGGDAGAGAPAEAAAKTLAIDVDKLTRVCVQTDEKLAELTLQGETTVKVFGDHNHLDVPQIEGVAAVNGETYYYFDCRKLSGFYEWLAAQDISYVGHSLKDDYYMLLCHGLERFETAFDTEVAQYVLDSSRSNYNLAALATEYLHQNLKDEKEFLEENGQVDLFSDPTENYMAYGCQVCGAILNLAEVQKAQIAAQKLEKVLYEAELPLVEVMASMEREGFRADKATLEEFGVILAEQIEELTQQIYGLVGEEFNINSPLQLGNILFEKLGLPAGKKTKRGYSTSADILEKLRDKHAIIPLILEYRTVSKLKSTYVDGLIPLISKADGKVHAHFNQTVTTTGRISCTEPNLQNIPIRQEMGRKLRKAFIPEENCVLVGADYSQIELRVLAHMSGDEALIASFNNGEDIHRATAARVLGVPEDEITLEERSRAKAINFGVIYGMSAFGLSSELHITRKDADDYIRAYFAKHAAVKEFMDEQVAFCKDHGYVSTLLGRKRFIKEINASAYMVKQVGERLAMNTPIQGSAADIIKLAMIKVFRALKEQGLKSCLILQVHDELIINTYPDEQEIVEKLLTENMETAYELAVKLKADLNEGNSWYELK